jgi:hypothetical protein
MKSALIIGAFATALGTIAATPAAAQQFTPSSRRSRPPTPSR